MQYPNSPLLKEWAEKLVELNNRDLFKGSVLPSAILFIEDTTTGAPKEPAPGSKKRKRKEPKPQKSKKPFDIKVLHPALAERLDADYMVIWYKLRSVYMDVKKLRAYLLETLMRIKPGGGLNPYDLKTFKSFAKGVGSDYEDKQFLGLDVLEEQLIKGTQRQAVIEFQPKAAPVGGDAAKPEAADAQDVPIDQPPADPSPAETPPAEQQPTTPGDGWQPDKPYADKSNVVLFQRPTGTDPTA